MTDNETTELAKLAYDAYGANRDYKNYQGLPMPAWEDLGDIQAAWEAAAEAIAERLAGPPAQDR